MRTQEGPFPMDNDLHLGRGVTDRDPDDAAQCREPAGFSTIAAPVMTAAMRRANRKDLANLKAILEQAQTSS